MNKLLNKVEWKEFNVFELFKIYNGKCSNMEKLLRESTERTVPFIGATHRHNGVVEFVEEKKNLISNGNALVFIKTGQGSSGRTIYKQEPFIGHSNVSIGYNKNLNRYTGNFIVTVMNQSRQKYNYGYGRTTKRLLRETLLLPSTNNGDPDWGFMELFMRKVEKEVKPNFKFKDHTINDRRELKDVMWKEFFIEDLFEVKRGKRLIKKNQIKGIRPYVSSKGLNNGVDNFISNKDNVRVYNDCLTIANSGSVGEVFYHPYEFVASDHVTHIKKKGLNKYQYLFLATIFKKLGEKYSFNREISDKRLKREKIMLPIDEKGEPDWGFMEQYMKRMENELMRPVI